MEGMYFYECYQLKPTRNVTSGNYTILSCIREKYFEIFYLSFDRVIPKRDLQIFKERVNKILECLPLSKDLVDDLLMVNGYRFKMLSTY